MKYTKKFIPLLVTAMLFLLSACGGSQTSSESSEKPTVKIGYIPITHAVPLYIENELANGKFENFNLELVKFGSWPNLMDALNTGRIEGASALITVAMRAKEQGIDLKAFALGHRDGNVLVVAPEIESAVDLKGKSFAIPHKFSTHNVLLYQMLKQEGVDYKDVNVIELPPPEMPAALAEGRIAGYVVAEPFGAQSVVMGNAKVLYQDVDIWKDSVDCALILREEFIQQEKIAQEFMNAYVEAGNKAEHKDEHAKEISSKYLQVNDEVLDLSLKWISYDNLRINQEPYNKLREYLMEMGLSENPPTFEEFVDNSLIDKVE